MSAAGGGPGVPLPGGHSNRPVLIGDRVHRIAGPWSPTVHAYLRHLRSRGVDEVPRVFGFDAEGREVLEHLPGEVPAYPMPDHVRRDGLLDDAARLLRRLHDASADLDRAGRTWQQPSRTPDEVISVNDYAPHNLVLREGRLVGVIDLDQASPGPRVRDVAHLAYRLVALTAPANADVPPQEPAERRRRLRLLAAAYGGPGPAEIVAAVPGVLDDLVAHATRTGLLDHAALYRQDARWLAAAGGDLDGEERG